MSDPRATLSALIEASGLSVSAFARDVLGRDVRTVRRWLSGETIPDSAAQWLLRLHVYKTGRDHVAMAVASDQSLVTSYRWRKKIKQDYERAHGIGEWRED